MLLKLSSNLLSNLKIFLVLYRIELQEAVYFGLRIGSHSNWIPSFLVKNTYSNFVPPFVRISPEVNDREARFDSWKIRGTAIIRSTAGQFGVTRINVSPLVEGR